MLVVLIVIDSHVEKTVLNSGKRLYIKEKNTLLGWLVAAAIRYPYPELESVADIILN